MTDQKKVLLIEDDPMVVRMYERKLKMSGYKLSLAYNGEEGFVVLRNETPDIILLDVMMPKMDGLETLKKIKADEAYKDVPVIILTNFGDRSEDVQKCKKMGAEDYWVKANMSLNEMVERINNILAKKK